MGCEAQGKSQNLPWGVTSEHAAALLVSRVPGVRGGVCYHNLEEAHLLPLSQALTESSKCLKIQWQHR